MLHVQDPNTSNWYVGMRGRAATLVSMALAVSLSACTMVDEGELMEEDLSVDQVAAGLTWPLPGAVSKPSWFAIEPPWQDGLRRKIINGYGSGLHQNTNSPYASNDYYALDFDLWLDETVYPIANGTVVYAGFAAGGWAGYGRIVFVDHGNGYQSLYAHLNSVEVAAGTYVTTTTRLGGAGNSGTNEVHLHLALYKGASFQNLPGSIGPYGGQAVVPEPFSYCVKGGGGSCEDLSTSTALIKRVATSCPYQSVQSRVHRDMNKDWVQALSIAQDKVFQVGAFHDGWGQLATSFTSILVTRPDGVVSRPPNLGLFIPPMVGTYTVQATCGSVIETATVSVVAKSCPYGSIQARVHRNINFPWTQSISINLGESFEVATFHDGWDDLTADTTSAISVTGPKAFTVSRQNLGTVIPTERGTYHVRSACGGLSDVATVIVN
jgi:murein DD-endopeptidase MepM/ murein hydrolase activator NlpD